VKLKASSPTFQAIFTLLPFETTIQEIEAQPADIPNFAETLNSISAEEMVPEETLFVGAGDSLAASMFIERQYKFRPRSIDPSELYRNPEVSKGKTTFFVSVSGRTKSNIEAATRIGGIARRKVAMTANPQSPLARVCSKTIELKFSKSTGLTPGTNSFTASLLACYRQFAKFPEFPSLSPIMEKAKKWAERQTENPDAVHFVASGFLFPIAMYGAAKIFEFCGGRADYQITEEFSHLNLFSFYTRDLAIILQSDPTDSTASKLADELNRQGYCAQLLDFSQYTDPLFSAVSASIYMQYIALNMALRAGLEQPAFLKNDKLLGISNRMIYFG
jgi:glutamine---fructose-6-phosphate transaminase (isomerizing)